MLECLMKFSELFLQASSEVFLKRYPKMAKLNPRRNSQKKFSKVFLEKSQEILKETSTEFLKASSKKKS